jgi:hypothetical protein
MRGRCNMPLERTWIRDVTSPICRPAPNVSGVTSGIPFPLKPAPPVLLHDRTTLPSVFPTRSVLRAPFFPCRGKAIGFGVVSRSSR